MSTLLERLARNARAQLHDWLQRYGIAEPSPTWRDAPPGDPVFDHEPEQQTGPLPHSPELEEAYRILDLPFGAPLPKVNQRWKAYLKRCHPDRFHSDPKRQSDHDRIEAAWQRAGRGGAA